MHRTQKGKKSLDKKQALEVLETALLEAKEDYASETDSGAKAFHHGRAKAFEEAIHLVESIGTPKTDIKIPAPRKLDIPKAEVSIKKPTKKPPARTTKIPADDKEPLTFKVDEKPLQYLTTEQCKSMSKMWLSMEAADKRIQQAPGTTRHAVQEHKLKAYEIGDPRMAYTRVEDFDTWAKRNGYKPR
jgi:hypothetical protein